MKTESEKINIGSLTKPHGITGEILLRILPQWENYSPKPSYLFIKLQGALVPFQLKSLRIKNDQEWLVIIDTINSTEDAQKLQNSDVYLDVRELGEASDEANDTYNISGYSVTDKNFGSLGKVKRVAEIHNNPLLEIEYNEKEILIPFQEDFILSINKEKKTILLNTPPGLIDLYLE
ncbi:MAG TPA: ribosome maturation factor RimM [Marinilabiliaceae bacterium]|nr:ribosome maturation factor RimM [Marinilabiliaceae bacterium]